MLCRTLSWVAVLLLISAAASAQTTSRVVASDADALVTVLDGVQPCVVAESRADRAWRALWAQAAGNAPAADAARTLRWDGPLMQDAAGQETARRRPKAIEYSEGYQTRMKIHRYASYATLPLAIGEMVLGESLYNNPSEGKKSAHLAMAAGLGGLFAVNSVTGVWNLMEARKDPNGRTRRMLHGILMLAADAGFVATAALAPDSEHEGEVSQIYNQAPGTGGSRGTHRAVALTSIGIGLASYVMMLLWRP
jgi:hypothetical protein